MSNAFCPVLMTDEQLKEVSMQKDKNRVATRNALMAQRELARRSNSCFDDDYPYYTSKSSMNLVDIENGVRAEDY